MTALQVNGQPVRVEAAPETPLLWVLRADLGLTGTKFGCGTGLCGACTVHLNGQPARACVLPLAATEGQAVTTIEGAQGPVMDALRAAWQALDVVQCGYCQSGQLMGAAALLQTHPSPDATTVAAAMDGHLCRCGTYQRIREAVALAAQRLAG